MTEELRRILWPKGHRPDIWAIVDAAQDQQVYWTLTNSFLPHSCLFAGPLPEALEMAAPYLVQLDPEDKFTAYLAKNLHRNVAVFLQTEASLHDLRHHLRTFLTVKDTSGRRMLFRYYDPRVLRTYLPTCNSTELQTVFGPVTSYWTISEQPGSLTQFEFKGKGLKVIPQAMGKAAAAAEEMAPVIVAAHSVIAVARGGTSQTRVPVLLQGAGGGGVLRRSSAAIKFFRTVSAPEELPFAGGACPIAPSQLDPDVTVYAEASSAAEVTLTLALTRGGKAEAKLLAVELAIDAGPAQMCAGTTARTRRRICVRPVEPRTFEGRLTLRSTPGGPPLTLFPAEQSAIGYALADGFSFDAPKESVSFWIAGEVPSKRVSDAALQLFVEGSQIAGALCPVTVVTLAPISAVIPGTPSKAKRLPEVSVTESSDSNPLVLLAGATDSEGPIRLQTEVTPAGVNLRWTVSRSTDDGQAIRDLSANPLPALQAKSGGAELLTDSAGTFHIRAEAEGAEEWGGPYAAFEATLVHAAVSENATTINGRFCACARVPGTDQFRLHAGAGAVKLAASVTLTGGGPDGKRGLESIRGGWINNIVSDNSGARYKGGKTRTASYEYTANGAPATVDFDAGPLLDAPIGESRCVANSSPGGPLAATAGDPASVEAQITPEARWSVLDGGPIEQLWRYLECRSYLVLWSTESPGQLGVLLQTGWSFTGDYACNATKTTRTIVPARLAPTGTTIFPALLPAARTDIEAHPPVSGSRGDE